MPQATFKTIDSLDVSGKRVLVRVDLNVPMKNGKVTDATRIERAVPTIAELAAKGARVVVLSHFGRPDGKRVPEMSLRALLEPLSAALGKPARLLIKGGTTEADKTIVEAISEPLLHVLRNALDHGLENAAERADARSKATVCGSPGQSSTQPRRAGLRP